jgi:hypothetical protein
VRHPQRPARRRAAAARVLASLALLSSAGAVAAIVLLLEPSGSSGSTARETTVAGLAEDPQSARGRAVTVTGALAQPGYLRPADAGTALVLTDGGARLLVLVAGSADPPRRPRPGTRLRVTGRVVVAPAATAGGTDVSLGALLARTRAAAGLFASAVEREDPAARATRPLRSFTRASVREVLRRPRRYRDALVAVEGRARRPGRYGFFLASGGRAVFVGAAPDDVRRVRHGQRVRLRVAVGRMSRFRADAAARALKGGRVRELGAPSPPVARADVKRGGTYLILREIR